MQKLGFIPEAQNDMIFSVICEELGLFGAVCLILLYLLIIWRLMIIANNASDLYGALIVVGIMAHLSIQVLLNIAVVTNTIPNTGVSLPFISYGGTSISILLAEMGLALSVSRGIMRIKEQRKRKKRRRIGICIFLVVLMLFALAALIVVKVFTVQNVVVEGNSLYSADQIKNMVLDDDYSWNSLYVDLKYRFVDVGEVPFVDTMEISLDDPHTLRISVTEKGILGSFYIDTLGQYAYFDKDGFVVETSSDVIEGVPKITGVTCDSVVLYEKLPLEDTKLLRNLLTLTQLLKKYELEPEEIHYDSAMQPQLTYGTIAVNVGSEDYLTQKIARLSAIMPQLSGLSGILHLETWTPDTTDIVFDRADL